MISDRINHRVQVLRVRGEHAKANHVGAIISSLVCLPHESAEDFARRVGYVAIAAVEEARDIEIAQWRSW